jgi:hypothetical protein
MTLTNENEEIESGEFVLLSIYESEPFLSINLRTEMYKTDILLG